MNSGTCVYGPLHSVLRRHPADLRELIHLNSAPPILAQTVDDSHSLLPFLPDDVPSTTLVLSADEPRPSGTNVKPEPRVGRGNASSYEYAGSPLKLESCLDNADVDRHLQSDVKEVKPARKDRPSLCPLPSRLARECLSAVMTSGIRLQSAVLCLSDPSPCRDKMLAVGCYSVSEVTTLLFASYEEIKRRDCKGRFGDLLQEYQDMSILSDSHVPTHASAEYSMMSAAPGSALKDSASEEFCVSPFNSTISIYVKWSNIEDILMAPPPDSVATISVNVVCGDKSSMVYSLHEELRYLKDLTAGLSSGKISWPEVERTTDPLELTRKLLQSQACDESYEEEAEGQTVQIHSIEPRKNHDFTDRLWCVLLGCQSYAELLEVMKCVTKSVSTKQCSPLMVSASASNPLARWIYAQQVGDTERSVTIDLGSLQALIYFIEMGVDKLTKDYIHTYLGNFSGLVTADKLDRFTAKSSSIQDRLSNLSKLHTVLELSALLYGYIRLPLATVRSATSSALKYLADNPDLPSDGFKLNTTVGSISDILNGQSPEVWLAVIGGNSEDKTTVKVTRTEPDHCVVLTAGAGEDADDTVYCSIVRQQRVDPSLT